MSGQPTMLVLSTVLLYVYLSSLILITTAFLVQSHSTSAPMLIAQDSIQALFGQSVSEINIQEYCTESAVMVG